MSAKPKVSVIIPVYNGEKTIAACINSVLNQTLKEIEVIVVNDGSTDNTDSILKEYGDKIIVLKQSNTGQGKARNVGLSVARGDYVGFVDADDTVESDMYRVMYQRAREKKAQLVQCGINDIRHDGSISTRAAFDMDVEIVSREDYVFDCFYRLKHTNEVCNKLIELKFLRDNGLVFSDTKEIFSEDLKLNIDMIVKLKRISFVSGGFYNYYIKDSGHCRSDLTGRVSKIRRLFEAALEQPMDKNVRKGFECTAAITILSYCAAADQSGNSALEALDAPFTRRCMISSMTYHSSLKHSLLMFALLYWPKKIRLWLLRKFYTF